MNFRRDRMWPSARTHLNGVKATNSKQASHQESKQHSGTPHHKMCTSLWGDSSIRGETYVKAYQMKERKRCVLEKYKGTMKLLISPMNEPEEGLRCLA